MDSDFFGTIYSGSNRKSDKDPSCAVVPRAPLSNFSMSEHDVCFLDCLQMCVAKINLSSDSQMRRAAINPFFSKAKFQNLEPQVTKKIDILCSRLAEYMRSNA